MNKKPKTEKKKTPQDHSGFDGLGIGPRILQYLDRARFHTPTPVQQQAIPPAVEGKDVIGVAQTGTGKTLAFAIPMVQQLIQQESSKALVLAPTRELAIQVEETVKKVASIFQIKTAILIGGAPMGRQIQQLQKNPRIIIATPGRLIDHCHQRNVDLKPVSILVLDEADRMLDMGFMPQIQEILKIVPKQRQTMLFSATMPAAILRIASGHMAFPIRVEIAPSGTTADKVSQELFIVNRADKFKLLVSMLEKYRGSILIFTQTKIEARSLARRLRESNFLASDIHSDRSLTERREALEGFKSGKYRVLVATDVAARGIDVTGIEAVINYDLPEDPESYVHRIGRTGRAGHQGHAISFAVPGQKGEVDAIERLIKRAIPVSQHPEVPTQTFPTAARPFRRRSFGSLRRR